MQHVGRTAFTIAIISLLLFVTVANAYSQRRTKKAKHNDYTQPFSETGNEDVLDIIADWKCNDGTYLDIKGKTPSVVFLGYLHCVPCRFLMGALEDVITETRYSNYNFIYITFDDDSAIKEEFKDMKQSAYKRLKIISVPKENIKSNNLASGYPTIYFLNSKKQINNVTVGGVTDGKKEAQKWWYSHLNAIE